MGVRETWGQTDVKREVGRSEGGMRDKGEKAETFEVPLEATCILVYSSL